MNRPHAVLFALALAFGGLPAAAAPFAYASDEGSATVSVIDTATDQVVRTIKTGPKPRGIAVALDGKRVFVSEQAANAVVVYDTADGKEVGRAAVGDSPEAVYLSPDGKRLSVAVEENDVVALVDTASLEVLRRIKM